MTIIGMRRAAGTRGSGSGNWYRRNRQSGGWKTWADNSTTKSAPVLLWSAATNSSAVMATSGLVGACENHAPGPARGKSHATPQIAEITLALPPCKERETLEQVHVLLVLQERPVQRRDQLPRVALAQRLGRDVLVQEQLDPVEQLGGG